MELESIMEESVELLEKSFYNKKFYYSYSSLNKLLWSPQVFYQLYERRKNGTTSITR
jgi:hypothetical protein